MKSWKERRGDTLSSVWVWYGCGRGLFARRDFGLVRSCWRRVRWYLWIWRNRWSVWIRSDRQSFEEKREFKDFLNYMKKLEAFLFQASLDTQEAMLDCYCGDDLQPTVASSKGGVRSLIFVLQERRERKTVRYRIKAWNECVEVSWHSIWIHGV